MQFLGGHIRLQTIGTAKLFTLSLQIELEFFLIGGSSGLCILLTGTKALAFLTPFIFSCSSPRRSTPGGEPVAVIWEMDQEPAHLSLPLLVPVWH